MSTVVALAELARKEIGESKGGEMYLRNEAREHPYEPSLVDWLERPDAAVIVGTIDDCIVAFSAVSTFYLRDGGRIAEAAEIFVLEEARGVGVGEAMLDLMMDWSREHDCTHLEGSVLPGNRHGKNFFERAHMVTRVLRVSTRLDG